MKIAELKNLLDKYRKAIQSVRMNFETEPVISSSLALDYMAEFSLMLQTLLDSAIKSGVITESALEASLLKAGNNSDLKEIEVHSLVRWLTNELTTQEGLFSQNREKYTNMAAFRVQIGSNFGNLFLMSSLGFAIFNPLIIPLVVFGAAATLSYLYGYTGYLLAAKIDEPLPSINAVSTFEGKVFSPPTPSLGQSQSGFQLRCSFFNNKKVTQAVSSAYENPQAFELELSMQKSLMQVIRHVQNQSLNESGIGVDDNGRAFSLSRSGQK